MIEILTDNITFFFTDIEGSTQLWEQHPEAMQAALARHDAILREAIETNNGHVFKTIGDEFCATFSAAPDALSAALTAQRALQAETWQAAPIKVRIALHTGAAEARDSDYFGPPLNRVARLLAAGHGAQTLLSAVTEALVRKHLPKDAELRDLGEWQLKDILLPEHIYQVLVPDLPTEFPPLKSMDALRTNLPAQLTSFIGREKEIAEVKQLITPAPFLVGTVRQERRRAGDEVRLVTLIGPGGTGKTRLSLEIAADLLDSFPDGVWFIELAPLTDPALVPQAAAAALGLREETGHSLLETLSAYLRPKTALLILDNCEHLVAASAQFAQTLLQACPNLRILTSSREALSIPGETAYRVPSLSIPAVDASPSLEALTQYEAARLFIDRAKTVLPGFTVTDKDAPIVAQICSRLDGIPLAIELAAVRVKILKVEQIAERLDDRFRLLTGGSRTALPRQQTLRALIDWSYDMLSEPESALLRRLSVFVSGWTLESAEVVCASAKSEGGNQKDEKRSKEGLLPTSDFILDPSDILDTMMQLINKSLIVMDADDIVPVGYEHASVETRYHLLETVRQYAREKLVETSEGIEARDAHLNYFLGFAERAESELTGPQVAECLRRLEVELDNLRAALEWSLHRDTLAGLRVVNALLWFWEESGHLRDGLYWLEQLLNQPQGQLRTVLRAKALSIQGVLGGSRPSFEESLALYRELGDQPGLAFSLLYLGRLVFQEDNEQAQRLITESMALYRKLGDKLGLSEALNHLGVIASDMKEYERAHAYLEEGLAICREIKYVAGMTRTLADLGLLALKQDDYPAARRWLEESLTTQNSLGQGGAIIYSLLMLGELSLREGDYAQARLYYERSLSVAEKTGVSPWAPLKWIPVHLGYIALRQGDTGRAKKHFQESQQGFKDTGITIGIVYTLEGQASLAALEGQPERAVRLFSWADAMRETIGNTRPTVEQADVDRDLAAIRAHLDEATCAAAQTAGRAMSMEQAIALTLEASHD